MNDSLSGTSIPVSVDAVRVIFRTLTSASGLALLVFLGCSPDPTEPGDAGTQTTVVSADGQNAAVQTTEQPADDGRFQTFDGVLYENMIKYGTTSWLPMAFESDLKAGRDDRWQEFIHESAEGLLARLRAGTSTPEEKAELLRMLTETQNERNLVVDGFTDKIEYTAKNTLTGLTMLFYLDEFDGKAQFTHLMINGEPAL